MHAPPKPPFTPTRLARFVRWALLWLVKYGLFVLADTREARWHMRKMRRCITRIVMAHALGRLHSCIVAPQGRRGAPRGFYKRRIHNRGVIVRAALAPLRRSLRGRDALGALCAMFRALWFMPRSVGALLKRLTRRLSRLAPIILARAFADALHPVFAPIPSPADSS